ncbi:MAG: hypothetical protein ACOYMN_01285 [Roseimicrobium sp.]
MSSPNKLMHRPKPPKVTEDLESKVSPEEKLRRKEQALRKEYRKMKVALAAQRLGIPTGGQRLPLAQQAAARRRALLQAAEFITTAILFAGACAWLYQWWLSRQ